MSRKLDELIEKNAEKDATWAIAYGLVSIARAQREMSLHIRELSEDNHGNASGPIHDLGKRIFEGLDHIGGAIANMAEKQSR